MSVSNALIEMYAKCGCIDQVLQLFDQMTRRDIISRSTVIAGLANHGKAREAIAVFRDLERSRVVKPNRVTFLALLSACVHGGLWRQGLEYFKSMKNYYHLAPATLPTGPTAVRRCDLRSIPSLIEHRVADSKIHVGLPWPPGLRRQVLRQSGGAISVRFHLLSDFPTKHKGDADIQGSSQRQPH